MKSSTPTCKEILDEATGDLVGGVIGAELINNFFCNVSAELSASIGPPPVFECVCDLKTNQTLNETLLEIGLDEVRRVVLEIDTNKSSGYSHVDCKLFKDALLYLCKFNYLLNVCVGQCRFLDAWKYATVVVIPKKGNVTYINNLRPILLLPLPGKVFERFLNNYLIDYIEGGHLLADQQMGVLQRRGFSN